MREDINANREKMLQEIVRLDQKMNELSELCYEMPPRMRECEKKCQEAEYFARRQVQKLDKAISDNIEIKNTKWSIESQEKYTEVNDKHFVKIEKDLDVNTNRLDALQNWIDIYMPLRLQH